MFSFAYILTILSVFSAVAIADEVKSGQTESVDEKRFTPGWGRWSRAGTYFSGYMYINYNWGWLDGYQNFAGCGVLPYSRPYWFKTVDAPAVARRSISIDAEHINHRRGESTVTCKSRAGQLIHLLSEDCQSAVKGLVSNKSSTSNCKSCAVRLVSPHGQLAATGVPVEALQQVADQILKSCVNADSANHVHRRHSEGTSGDSTSGSNGDANHVHRRHPEETTHSGDSKKETFAMILEKGDGANCSI